MVAVAAACAVMAQKPTAEQMGAYADREDFTFLHYESKLGSTRLIDGEGRVEMTFTGTLLISKLDGEHTITGDYRKEFEGDGRVVYTGTAKLVLSGKFRAIQWFGRDMKAIWYGKGVARLVGEFDKNMETGFYWYTDKDVQFPWYATSITTVVLPPYLPGINKRNPVRRGDSKAGEATTGGGDDKKQN